MGYPVNKDKNMAIVCLKKAGFSNKSICRAFGDMDYKNKGNFLRVWRRDKNKYQFTIKIK